MKPMICPICNGTGKYWDNTCHGCGGRGWVEVHEDYFWYPYTSWPPYYPNYDGNDSPPYEVWVWNGQEYIRA